MDGNWFASLMLILWPFFVVIVFSRFSCLKSSVICLTAGSLFLPSVSFNLPVLPPLDRLSIPALTTLLAVLVTNRQSLSLRRLPLFVQVIAVVTLLGVFLTVVQNMNAIVVGGRVLEALTYYEGISFSIRVIFLSLLPFLLGYSVVHHPKDLKFIFIVLAAGGLIYSLFVAYEIRMSPGLHRIFYGFNQHAFGQTRRFGGWRPMVFMSHGLELALFMTTSVLAATCLVRTKASALRGQGKWMAVYLLVITVFCKSMASWFYLLFALPLVAFCPTKQQMRYAALAACLIASYPALRILDLFPTEILAEQMGAISEERAESLNFRFRNESLLVEHAKTHLFTGWGRYGRGQVHNERTGKGTAFPDGYWLVVLTTRGLIGLLTSFGLFFYPIYRAWRFFPRIRSKRERVYVSGLSWIVVIIGLDLLPNAMLNSLTYFLPGALLAAVHKPTLMPRKARQKVRVREKKPPRVLDA